MLTSKLVAAAALVTSLALGTLAFAQNGAPAATPPVAPAAAPAKAPATAAAMEYAIFHTNKGDIVIELDHAKAPISAANFARYITDGFYDGTVFHRVMAGFVIQGGGFDEAGVQKKTKDPISNEWQNGLKNNRGTLSMARTADPNSATSQFFVNLKDNAALDMARGGAAYAVFGKVIAGMEVVDVIAAVKCFPKGLREVSSPVEAIVVSKAEIITKEAADKLVAAAPKTPAPAAPTAPAAPAAGK